MSQMDHKELLDRIEKRFDKIEAKLDRSLEQVATNKADIKWVQGYIKVSLSALITLGAGVVTTIIRVFFKT
jgi:hypothetical protein